MKIVWKLNFSWTHVSELEGNLWGWTTVSNRVTSCCYLFIKLNTRIQKQLSQFFLFIFIYTSLVHYAVVHGINGWHWCHQGKPKRVSLTLKRDTKCCIATLQCNAYSYRLLRCFWTFSLPSFPLVSFSTVIVPKSGKGRPAAARRSTVDDKSTLMTCIENGEFTKAAKISSGEPVARVIWWVCFKQHGMLWLVNSSDCWGHLLTFLKSPSPSNSVNLLPCIVFIFSSLLHFFYFSTCVAKQLCSGL